MDREREELQPNAGSQPFSGKNEAEGQESVHTGDTSPENSASPDEVISALKRELEEAKKEAENWQAKAEQHREHYMRALADLENYRRRARKEKEDAIKYSVVPLLESLLPVLDNFERALDAADDSGNVKTLQEGIEMVYRQFLNALSQAGLTLIETEGRPFDPHEHNAVMQVESSSHEPGTIVEELQPGYRYLDRVIRPSMVKVSK
ncbi:MULTISPECIES: nucleotide exchange factor GrpE [Thermoactinomyces]|jgi:molecular chaperone GrpE|uniref:Protein GrpE n=1 Tax=Thermoactinomyces daqus TaxID=1329516 RepID=A0A7W1X9N1_9BACL|nr:MULTISPECIES: nucleotide exchange factor GrpE [Thermoactinomyces]MBA4542650.1 nucleotide exchange factor GrpE [Thermoactinomyces daqus]MBH8597370.1 nucleotide exchange factor GrpE [Thermoactinomyces sp. CICC 10523]MBH8602931.1 nucleotide exchange factor GrpE [Thermoactinomyces sp. CICC 10522]MBH8607221.1 nucleotide exchange factor GrpE [Thermoactinomyces sp. CICC 10521]